jgi:hypothetical protein
LAKKFEMKYPALEEKLPLLAFGNIFLIGNSEDSHIDTDKKDGRVKG